MLNGVVVERCICLVRLASRGAFLVLCALLFSEAGKMGIFGSHWLELLVEF